MREAGQALNSMIRGVNKQLQDGQWFKNGKGALKAGLLACQLSVLQHKEHLQSVAFRSRT
jgi:hypothetical protein